MLGRSGIMWYEMQGSTFGMDTKKELSGNIPGAANIWN